jgi:hypothetical protein
MKAVGEINSDGDAATVSHLAEYGQQPRNNLLSVSPRPRHLLCLT